jgi:recombination associated protein RdgC
MAFAGFSAALLQTRHAPAGQMAAWLFEGEAPFDFSIDRDCELHASDASRAVVRYSRKPLDTEEVRIHIQAGMAPTKLAMTYDDRISFVLTDAGNVQRVEYLDVVANNQRTQDMGAFDADVSIATGELSRLLPALLKALGGEALPALKPAEQVADTTGVDAPWNEGIV